jgi:uncharacterized protein YhbP (UPF0306 family)
MDAQTLTRVVAFLDAHHVASLATCGREGPHAANVFYVREGLALLWVSDPESRHSADLAADPRIAATVAPDYSDMDDIRGVQISGRAHVITSATDCTNARSLLEARYPCVKRLSEGESALREVYENIAFYRLEPARMVLIDNSRGFGHKDTLDVENKQRLAP